MIPEGVFRKILKGKVVIVGIGNILRGDDGLGPTLVDRLKGRVEVTCINAGNALENHLGLISRAHPDTVLLVDAVHLGLDPGEARIVDPSRIEHAGLSTHDVSPGLFLDFLVEESKCSVFLLGVQPESIEMGSGISETVEKTLEILESELLEVLGSGVTDLTDQLSSESVAAFGTQ
jgi:hydrogenase 3 maturation protease